MTTRIGILSDTHGSVEITRRAVSLAAAHDVDVLIHLGDVGSPLVLDALLCGLDEKSGECRPEVRVVFGNTDYDADALADYATQLGFTVDHPVGRLEIEGKTIVFLHGDCSRSVNAAIDEPVDYLFHGHTHVRRDEYIGPTRVINPGALHRAREYTVAILDVSGDSVTFLTVPRSTS